MELVVIWLALSVGIGVWAGRWDRNGLLWGLLAFVISPLLAAVALLIAGNRLPLCPACKGTVPLGATACRNCGRDL